MHKRREKSVRKMLIRVSLGVKQEVVAVWIEVIILEMAMDTGFQ